MQEIVFILHFFPLNNDIIARGGREHFCVSNLFMHWLDAEAASPEFRINRKIHYDYIYFALGPNGWRLSRLATYTL